MRNNVLVLTFVMTLCWPRLAATMDIELLGAYPGSHTICGHRSSHSAAIRMRLIEVPSDYDSIQVYLFEEDSSEGSSPVFLASAVTTRESGFEATFPVNEGGNFHLHSSASAPPAHLALYVDFDRPTITAVSKRGLSCCSKSPVEFNLRVRDDGGWDSSLYTSDWKVRRRTSWGVDEVWEELDPVTGTDTFSKDLDEGLYRFIVTVRDPCGRVSSPRSRQVRVDTMAPTVNLEVVEGMDSHNFGFPVVRQGTDLKVEVWAGDGGVAPPLAETWPTGVHEVKLFLDGLPVEIGPSGKELCTFSGTWRIGYISQSRCCMSEAGPACVTPAPGGLPESTILVDDWELGLHYLMAMVWDHAYNSSVDRVFFFVEAE